jgi:hypothetical protein
LLLSCSLNELGYVSHEYQIGDELRLFTIAHAMNEYFEVL